MSSTIATLRVFMVNDGRCLRIAQQVYVRVAYNAALKGKSSNVTTWSRQAISFLGFAQAF